MGVAPTNTMSAPVVLSSVVASQLRSGLMSLHVHFRQCQHTLGVSLAPLVARAEELAKLPTLSDVEAAEADQIATELETIANLIASDESTANTVRFLYTWLSVGSAGLADPDLCTEFIESNTFKQYAVAEYFMRQNPALPASQHPAVAPAIQLGHTITAALARGDSGPALDWLRAAAAAGADVGLLRTQLRCQDVLRLVMTGNVVGASTALATLLQKPPADTISRQIVLATAAAAALPPAHPRGAQRLESILSQEIYSSFLRTYLRSMHLNDASLLEEVVTAGTVALRLGAGAVALPDRSAAAELSNLEVPANKCSESVLICPIGGRISSNELAMCLPNGRVLSVAGVTACTKNGVVHDPYTDDSWPANMVLPLYLVK